MMSREEISKLIQDELFLSYCFQKDATAVSYWEEKLKTEPENRAEILELKKLIVLMAFETGQQSLDAQKDTLQKRIAKSAKIQKRSMKIWYWSAAAAVLLIISGSLGYLAYQQNVTADTKNRLSKVKPGGNSAILRLANGQEIALNKLQNGTVLKQQNLSITKAKDGTILYKIDAEQNNESEQQEFNTIITPNGGTYKVNLPDGTNIWLNAKSELKYPLHFGKTDRKVELVGEAYFEVMTMKNKPFFVLSRQQTIEVLGTHFNVNAYADETLVKTALLQGMVKVSASNQPGTNKILHPGQMAVWNPHHAAFSVQETDTELAVAWKNGLFQFKDADLTTILRCFSRWYNIDIVANGKISDRTFSGKLYRNVNAYQALQVLKLLGLDYSLEKTQPQQPLKIIIKP
ncbi:FecR family protein [Pedobacter sp. MC2016-24]|uniref:FecR family protein n=1 Tax=Pedobacter sp. MC2016-24 TaxID=2780090 RepID=UPI00187E2A3A|nr:FecR family protein [Pedobacter sp. MC2016-24]MBE9602239.1 FecR domain-containing protein [Pedobacter sp. MC2016-24]